jgi:hypothetical protein
VSRVSSMAITLTSPLDEEVLCEMNLSDPMPPQLQAWLKANGKGNMVDAGFQPLVAFTVAADQGLPPMPDDVLQIWSLLLATGRIMVLQGSMAFIRQARRAGKSDEQIRRALLLGRDIFLDQHLDELQRQVMDIQTMRLEAHNERRRSGAAVGANCPTVVNGLSANRSLQLMLHGRQAG